MPRVVARTEKMVLVECEYLTPRPSRRQMEQVKEQVCRYCGFYRDVGKFRLRVNLVCLHPDSPYWDKFLKAVKEP